MRFCLIDAVVERTRDRLVAVKAVSRAEEYLADHFPGFEVLPGVMMVEAVVQAARLLLEPHAGPDARRLVLGGCRAVKYGTFVRPGQVLRVTVTLLKAAGDGSFEVKGEGAVAGVADGPAAISGRFTLRPARPDVPGPPG